MSWRPLRSAVATRVWFAICVKLAEAGAIFAVQHAFGLSLSAESVLVVLAATALGSVVPVAPANIGTYEAAIENMLRRMDDQGDADANFYLHRVQVDIDPDRINDGYRDENDEPARKIGEKHRESSSRRPRRGEGIGGTTTFVRERSC